MEMSVTRGVLGGGGQELREAVSNVLLKSLLLQNCPCHVIFFATLTTSNVCHGAEGINKTFLFYNILLLSKQLLVHCVRYPT